MTDKIRSTFRIDEKLYEKIRKIAFDSRQSVNNVIVKAIKKYLEGK
jgi:predicted HicB family RNase H-like nuclease